MKFGMDHAMCIEKKVTCFLARLMGNVPFGKFWLTSAHYLKKYTQISLAFFSPEKEAKKGNFTEPYFAVN